MDIGRGRIVFSLVILCISVHCAASDNQVCRVEERLNMGLSKIDAPATILSVVYDYHSAPDCYQACCNYTGNQCNAVSYYDAEYLCMLLSCNPFGNCVWVTADGFTAARTKLTTVADDALPPLSPSPSSSTNSQLTSSTTSQQQSVWLAEGMTPTTTQATLQTAQAPSTLGGFGSSTTQPLTAETSSNPVQASSLPDSTNSTGVSDWNVNGESETPAEGAIPIGMSPIGNPDPSEPVTTEATIQGGDDNQPEDDYQQQQQQQQQEHQFNDVIDPQPIDEWQSPIIDAPAPLNPDDETSLEEPVFVPEERPREMKRTFIQSPGIIIGLCSALGVAFLVLLAVCRKVYLSHDRPRYKPLRDYDIRFEPPAASSALLP